jgi:putative transposase
MSELKEDRRAFIILRQAGMTQKEVAAHLGRSERWVRKWEHRVQVEGRAGLYEKSRAPHKVKHETAPEVREAIIQARKELEKGCVPGQRLKYIGGPAIRTVLKGRGCHPLPSVPTIERVVREAGLTRPKKKPEVIQVNYPHLTPSKAHQLIQVDIVPHYLKGGAKIACFNAIDVYSRYPTGQAFEQRRSVDAEQFMIHTWQTIGIPQYTQVDNEGCFSGGATHPYVLGRVVRLALAVGTELIFSPTYHPKSNGYVERFHQDYNQHVWEDTYLPHLEGVNAQADLFFQDYRNSGHHSCLSGRTPKDVHYEQRPRLLRPDFEPVATKRPLTAGKVHFIRAVQQDKTVRVLNVDWPVSTTPESGVWVTLNIQTDSAQLEIYDKAPDQADRICLNTHSFPLTEAVVDKNDPLIPSAHIEACHQELDEHQTDTDRAVENDSFLVDSFLESGWLWLQKNLIASLVKGLQQLE